MLRKRTLKCFISFSLILLMMVSIVDEALVKAVGTGEVSASSITSIDNAGKAEEGNGQDYTENTNNINSTATQSNSGENVPTGASSGGNTTGEDSSEASEDKTASDGLEPVAGEDNDSGSDVVNIGSNSPEGTDLIAPTAPGEPRAVEKLGNYVTIGWTASTDDVGVVEYEIYNSTTMIGVTSGECTYTISALMSEETYLLSVKAKDAAGNRSEASETLVLTVAKADWEAPSAPTGLEVSEKTESSITITWSASTDDVGVAEYELYNGYEKVKSTTETRVTLTELLPLTTYNIMVRAKDAVGNISEASEELSVKTNPDTQPPTVPTELIVRESTDSTVTITWTSSEDNIGVTEYDIYNGAEKVASSADTVYTLTGLAPNTTYSITIRAKDASGNISEASRALIVKTNWDNQAPSIPSGLIVTDKTETSITIKWESSTDNVGIKEYEIYNGTEKAATATDTILTLKDLAPNTTYKIMVRAKDASGNISLFSEELLVKTSSDNQPPSVPGSLEVVEKTETTITIKWIASTDNIEVKEYEVYNGLEKVGSTTETTYLLKELIPNTTYKLTVRAKDNAGNISEASSELSATTNADTQPPTVPTDLEIIEKTETSITIGWTPSTDNVGVEEYEIYNGSEKVDSTKETTFSLKELKPDTTYRLTVKARDAANNLSEASNEIAVATNPDRQPPTAPQGLEVIDKTETSITVRWIQSLDNICVEEYEIYNGFEKVGSTKETTFTLKELNPNTTYAITVKARDTASNLSEASSEIAVATNPDIEAPTIPTGLAVSKKTSTSVTLVWNASKDNVAVTGYEIYNGAVKVGAVTNNLTYTVKELVGNKPYTFTIKAVDSTGNTSEPSEALTVVTMLPALKIKGAGTTSSIFVIWNETVDAISYELEIDGTIMDIGNITQYIHSGLQQGSQHSYRVRAKNENGEGDWSNSITLSAVLVTTTISSNITLTEDVVYGKLVITGGELSLKGFKVVVAGDLEQRGGILNVNGGRVSVIGSYSVISGATLRMTNEADYVYVGGNFTTVSERDSRGNLTAGAMEVKGNFTQKNTGYYSWKTNFSASGSHKVILNGSSVHMLSFTDPYDSGFNVLEVVDDNGMLLDTAIRANTFSDLHKVRNTGSEVKFVSSGLSLKEDTTISSNFTLDGTQLNTQGRNINITGSLLQSGGKIYASEGREVKISVSGNCTTSGEINISKGNILIGGELKQSGVIIVNGGKLIVNSNYTMTGSAILNMTNSLDYVYVGGDFTTVSERDSRGNLTAGVMEVKGNFTQKNTGYYSWKTNFSASGSHIVILNGINTQTVTFQDPRDSIINILITTKPISSYKFNTTPVWNYLLENYKYTSSFGRGSGTNFASGNYSRNFTDMQITSPGLDITFSRSYNSRDTKKDGGFGKGWTFSFECSLKDYGDGVNAKKAILPDGSVQIYTVNPDGTFTAEDSRNTLTRQADGSYVITTKDQYKYIFNSNGYLTTVEDRHRNTTSIIADASGKVQSVKDSVNRTYRISYNADGLIQSIQDTENRVVRYEYENKQLVRVIDPMNQVTNYLYDSKGLMCEIKDNNNNRVEFIAYYDEQEGSNNYGKVIYTIDASGNKKEFNYDIIRQKTTITDSKGRQTNQYYNSSYNVITSVDSEGKSTITDYYKDTYGLDKYGEEKSVTDRNGNTTQYTRDGKGNITKQINPDSSTKEFIYDDKNNVIQEKDENGKLTFYIYDQDKKLLLRKVQPLNGTDVYTSGADVNKFAITTYIYYSDSEAQQAGCIAKGLLKEVIDPNGNKTSYTYDAYGNVKTVTNPEGKTTASNYNSIGWEMDSTTPKGNKTKVEYNPNGNVERVIQQGGETTRIVYDNLGRKIKEVSPKQYDVSLDNKETHTYSGNHGTRYTYYPNGQVKTVTDAENKTIAYTYDLYGNVATQTMPNGAVYSFEYDVMNRPIRKYFKENASTTEILLEEYSYLILSDRKTQTSVKKYLNDTEIAVTTLTYDYAGRLVEQKNPDGTVKKSTYNANGTKSSDTDERGSVTYYKYDGLNRLTEMWVPVESINGVIKYSYTLIVYDKAGNKISQRVGKTLVNKDEAAAAFRTESYEYYKDGKVKTIVDDEGRKTEYYYDDDGNLSKEIKYYDSSSASVTEYENNHLGKPITKTVHVLSGDIYGNDFGGAEDIKIVSAYTYDKNGNLETETTADGVKTTITYDNLNREKTVSYQGKDEYGKNVTITTSKTYNWEGKVVTSTDARGNTIESIYDARGFLVRQKDAKGGITLFVYDRAGRVISEISAKNQLSSISELYNVTKEDPKYDICYDLNKDGIIDIFDIARFSNEGTNLVEYQYDIMNRVKTKIDKYWHPITGERITLVSSAYKYDAKGNVIKELDALGYANGIGTTVDAKINSGYGTEYTYNLADKVVTVLDAVSKERSLSFTKKYTYDALGRVTTETDAKGQITSYTYNNAGNMLTKTIKKSASVPEKLLQTNTYDYLGNLINSTDGNGNKTSYEYNSFGQIRKAVFPGDASISPNTVIYQYDIMGNLVLKQDSTGNTHKYTFDSDGRMTSDTESKADGSDAITTYAKYDVNGSKRFETDGNNVTTETVYDELNRVKEVIVKVKNSAGTLVPQKTTYGYDKNGNLVTVTDWRNNTTTSIYDPLNRLIEKKDASGKTIQKLEYYANGTQSKSYDALGNATTYEYDKNKRLLKTTDPELSITSQTYDNCGNIATKVDGKNQTTNYSYDELNRLVSVLNAKGETTTYTYDLNGNMLTQTDGKGNFSTYEYNAANKLVRRVDAGGVTNTAGTLTYDPKKTETYTYYADGQLKTKTDRNGKVTTYGYDIHGRKVSESVGSIIITYTYDRNGNMLTMTDSTGTTTRTYDELNRVTSKTVPGIGKSLFVYDKIDNSEKSSIITEGGYAEVTTDPKGNKTSKIYDKVGRLKVIIADGKATTYNYNDNGSKESVLYPDGSSETYTYNKDNTLKALVNKKADGTVLDSYSYTYDKAKNQLTKVDSKGTTSYVYDVLNRLLTVTEPSGRKTTYSYDKAGNRETETVVANGVTVVKTYTYNEQNRLTKITIVQGSTTIGTITYGYDNNGNQLTETITGSNAGATTNTYDELNQLVKTVTADGQIINNRYNAEGLRVSKDVAGAETRYLYEGDKIILELDGSGNEKARNVYGTNIIGRTVIGKDASGNTQAITVYYMYNGHGDVTKLITGTGEIMASYYYDAFGTPIESQESIDNPYKYSGYQYDAETGKYYIKARMYDPQIARFMQEDTYRGDPNDPLSLNLYTYCFNNPIVYWDPSGHKYVKKYDGSSLRTFWEDDVSYKWEMNQLVKVVVKEDDFWKDDSFFNKDWWKDQKKVSTALNKINNEIETHADQAHIKLYETSNKDIVGWRRLNVVEAVLGSKVTSPGDYDGRSDLRNAVEGLQVKYGINSSNALSVGKAEVSALINRTNERIKRAESSAIWKTYYNIGDMLAGNGFYLDIYMATGYTAVSYSQLNSTPNNKFNSKELKDIDVTSGNQKTSRPGVVTEGAAEAGKTEAVQEFVDTLRSRILGYNHEQGRFSYNETLGISRAEKALNKRFEPSNTIGVDMIDPKGLGNVSLKGPFLNASKEPLTVAQQQGVIKSLQKHISNNTAVDAHIIDALGLNDDIVQALQEALKDSSKKIIYIK